MGETVPASEFIRNFGRYQVQAQCEPVAVSSHGKVIGYFVGPDDYEAFKRFQDQRHSFATEELSDEKIKAIAGSRMDPRHDYLGALLDPK
jgi:PHD/YefM family antitoxin component YafN of YafNO toxin-antitoxin module